MFTQIWRTVFASALFLTLAVSAWAAEEKQAPPAKAEKMGEMEKKPETPCQYLADHDDSARHTQHHPSRY